MKQIYFLVFIFSLIASSKSPYYFETEQKEVITFLAEKKPLIKKIAQHYEVQNCASAIAVVAPEVIRYHLLRDFFETKALEQWYVHYGKDKADFSIGYFQMKPSFIEDLEWELALSLELKKRFKDLLVYQSPEIQLIRKERIERLKQLEWQFRYALCYFAIAEECFAGSTFINEYQKIRFYATAYNYGFQQPISKIENWQKIEAFPYGQKFKFDQIAYGELAKLLYPDIHKLLNDGLNCFIKPTL